MAPFWGTYTFLKYKKSKVRKEIKKQIIAGIDRNKLTVLKFTKEEAATELWWKHSKEFEYKGEMYDVVKSQEKGDSIQYWCWPDKKETLLNKQLKSLVTITMKHNPLNQKKSTEIIDFFKLLYCEDMHKMNNLSLFQSKIKFIPFLYYITSVSVPPPKPPP